jgi:hypothetical protein
MISRLRRCALGLFACAATCAASWPALAQSFDASGPRRPLVLPLGVGAEVPGPALAPPEAPSVARDEPSLRPFPALPQAALVKGTVGTLSWPVALTVEQAARDVAVTLAPVSSIAVRPDTSFAVIAVNGTAIGRMWLGLPDAPATMRVPPGLLKPGMNVVAVTVRQDHRVDCSPMATFELTTAFDGANSGLVVAPLHPVAPADLAAAVPRADGALVISVAADRALAADVVPSVARAVQAIALLSGTLQPVVEIVPDASAASGVVLALGPAATLGRLLPGIELRGGAVSLMHPVTGTAPVLAIRGETAEALDQALAPLEEVAKRTTAERIHDVTAGSVPLAPNEATARLLGPRAGLAAEIVLPADAFPADYGQATVKVRGTLAPDVLSTARLVVSVNGRDAATTTIARGGWGQPDQATVTLPYGLLRPGRNRVELAAELPTRADAACEPLRRTDETRLTLFPESVIELSAPARALRLPELAAFAAGGLPLAGGEPVSLRVPRPDRGSLEAALTLVARLAVSAGTIVPVSFAADPARAAGARVITVGPLGALDGASLAAAGLDRSRLATAWSAPRRRPAGDDACGIADEIPVASTTATPPAPAARHERDATAWLATLARRGADRLGLSGGIANGGAGLAAAADLVLAQARDGSLVLIARDSATLAAATACLVRPRTWDRLAGQAAGLDLASGGVTVARPAGLSLAPTDWSPGNLRRVLAGWLSLNAYAYLAVSLFAAVALGAGTAGVVRRAGRSQP